LATINISETEVFAQPDRKSEIIEKLTETTQIAASNYPVNGYYRVRTPKGKIGWVADDALDLQPIPPPDEDSAEQKTSEESDEPKRPASKKEKTPAPQERAASPSSKPKIHSKDDKNYPRYILRGFGSMNFFTASGIIGGYDSFSNGYGFGGEFTWNFFPRWGWVVRVERISTSVALADSGTSKNYLVSLSSLPLVTGVEFSLFKTSRFSASISGLAGTTLQMGLTSTSVSDTSNNVTTISTSALSFLGKANLHFFFNQWLSIFAEGGYRYMNSPVLTLANPTDVGSLILQSSFSIKMSGPFVGAGVAARF
jgi:hypothetical protein